MENNSNPLVFLGAASLNNFCPANLQPLGGYPMNILLTQDAVAGPSFGSDTMKTFMQIVGPP